MNWHRHTETRSVEKYSPDPHTYQKGLKLLKGREGWELDSLAHRQIDLQQSARIRKNSSIKHRLSDPQRSARICKDSLAHRQSATPARWEPPSPCDHPASCHMRFRGNLLTPVRHKPATSIGSILTLPKLHLATFINVTTTNIGNR